MVETKDHRKFFTHEKNYVQLIEFSKTFGAEISVVKVNEAEILDLPQMAGAICNKAYKIQKPEFEIVETKVEADRKKRTILLKTAKSIRQYIKNAFLSGKEVDLKKIREKYSKHNLTLAAFCNHLATVRKNLKDEGHEVTKLGGGKYKIV